MDRPVYLARDARTGTMLLLDDRKHSPRAQLMDKLATRHADPMYRDNADGTPSRCGYIVAGGWWDIYEVRPAAL